MNNLILEIITSRAKASGNTAVLDALDRLNSPGGASLQQDPKELLAQLGARSPLLGALAKQYCETEPGGACGASGPIIDIQPEAPEANGAIALEEAPADEPDSSNATETLRQQVQSMFDELNILRERCDLLAAALGACCLCWGEDPSCRACRGRGRPGFAVPDEALSSEFLLPAVRMLRAQRATTSGSSPLGRTVARA